MKGDFVLTERDLLPDSGSVRSPLHTDAIAICDYSMDSHGNAPPNSFHPKITEGVFNAFVVPYQIPYSVLLSPNIDGLLVTCAVSASHVAFSSLRMEPTWAALGQAGGLAAVLAIDNDQEFREIEVARLQTKLWQQKAMTVYISDGDLKDGDFIIYQFFGTRGYFHHLPEYADAPFIGRGKKGGLPGQFILKYPYHDLNLDKLMDRNLAVNWSKMAGIQWIDNQWESMNRTEFLIELYSKFDNHD